MAIGFPAAQLDTRLDNFTDRFVQLHSGDPGAVGTANISTATTVRKQATLGVPDTSTTNRRRRNTAIVRWEGADVTGTQSNTHFGLWTLATGGVFIRSFALDSSVSLVAGTPAEIPINGLVVQEGPLAS